MGPNTSPQPLFFLLAWITPAQAWVPSLDKSLFGTIYTPDAVLYTGDSTVNKLHVAPALKGLRVLLGMHTFPGAVLTKHHKQGGFKQQNFIVSQFGRPEVQNQGFDSAVLLPKFLVKNPSMSLSASGGCG